MLNFFKRLSKQLKQPELWEVETQKYLPRIAEVGQILKPALDYSKELPVGPFEAPFDAEQTIAYHLALFGKNGLIVFDQLSDNVGLLWSEGRMVGVSGLVRFGLEYWAAVHFGLKIIHDLKSDGDIHKAQIRTARLTFSGKTPVALPWGGVTKNDAYNILNFIDNLNKQETDIRILYNLLSESSHPNFLQNTYFVMASRRYDNFSNEAFKEHAHELLDQTVFTLEKSAVGIAKDTKEIFDCTIQKFQL